MEQDKYILVLPLVHTLLLQSTMERDNCTLVLPLVHTGTAEYHVPGQIHTSTQTLVLQSTKDQDRYTLVLQCTMNQDRYTLICTLAMQSTMSQDSYTLQHRLHMSNAVPYSSDTHFYCNIKLDMYIKCVLAHSTTAVLGWIHVQSLDRIKLAQQFKDGSHALKNLDIDL